MAGNTITLAMTLTVDCEGAHDFRATGVGVCNQTAQIDQEALARRRVATKKDHGELREEGFPIVWEVERVQTRAPVAPGSEQAVTGLAWQDAVPGRASPLEGRWSKTDAHGASAMTLTDIIGERTITVYASIMMPSVRAKACTNLETGPGPFSRFTVPTEQPVDWATHMAHCEALGLATPTVKDLQTVSLTGRYNAQVVAKGAAMATGCPTDETYWAEPSPARGGFARQLQLRTGSPHGRDRRLIRRRNGAFASNPLRKTQKHISC